MPDYVFFVIEIQLFGINVFLSVYSETNGIIFILGKFVYLAYDDANVVNRYMKQGLIGIRNPMCQSVEGDLDVFAILHVYCG